ncbi:MAG: Holliday junction resolvase RuvX [bacterium]|nr:Holliday junction resolvase RuvX [bacterium]
MEEQARVLGLDVGEKTIGVAVSDPLGLTAQPVKTIRRSSQEADLAALRELVALYTPERFVVGYPRSLSGEIGPQARFVETFVERLAVFGLPVDLVDERLTTRQATQVLIAGGLKRKERKAVIDQQAAVLILQSHLDRRARSSRSE